VSDEFKQRGKRGERERERERASGIRREIEANYHVRGSGTSKCTDTKLNVIVDIGKNHLISVRELMAEKRKITMIKCRMLLMALSLASSPSHPTARLSLSLHKHHRGEREVI
jgi:hypothetical protein